MTWIDIGFITCAVGFLGLLYEIARVRRELEKKAYRGDCAAVLRTELADLSKTVAEAHRRCSEALKSKTEHEDRIRELYERCNSLQAQINVANRAAEAARGVRQ